MDYVQTYLRDVGERKCEANAIIVTPGKARELCDEAIVKYLGPDARTRFSKKRDEMKAEFEEWKQDNDIDEKIQDIIDLTPRR
jgi:hypothetical protein